MIYVSFFTINVILKLNCEVVRWCGSAGNTTSSSWEGLGVASDLLRAIKSEREPENVGKLELRLLLGITE